MTTQMIATVQERVTIMLQDSQIVSFMNQFSTPEAAQEFIIKAAIATLVVPVEER